MMSLATLPPAPSSYTTSTMHDKQPTDTTSTGVSSNVSRLKNMFQVDDPHRGGATRTTRRMSPDTKRKRVSESDSRPTKQRSPDGGVLEPALADPQKFYETTNHVQRFQLTRSMFEKMEQKNHHGGSSSTRASRSKSPAATRTVSPSPARSPTSPIPRLTSPGADSKDTRYRAGSVENIIDEQTYNRKFRYPPAASNIQDLSKSESDLTRERSGSDVVVTTSIQHPKSLIEQYESKSSSTVPPSNSVHSTGSRRTYSRSPSREPAKETSPNSYSGKQASSSLPSSSSASSEPAYRSRFSGSSRQQQQTTSRREPSPSSRPPPASSTAAGESDSDIVERWRNRYNRDKHSAASSVASSTSSSTTQAAPLDNHGAGGALLWKRRSQEESGISKEEIEASLADADRFFGDLHGGRGDTSEVMDSRMTDSTISTGSGEEMARSDSGHDLTSTPDSPTTPTNDYNWTAAASSKPDLPPKPPQSEPPSYHASMGRNSYSEMIQDDLDADYVDITATITPPTKKAPPTPTDSLAKRKSGTR